MIVAYVRALNSEVIEDHISSERRCPAVALGRFKKVLAHLLYFMLNTSLREGMG